MLSEKTYAEFFGDSSTIDTLARVDLGDDAARGRHRLPIRGDRALEPELRLPFLLPVMFVPFREAPLTMIVPMPALIEGK